MKNFVLIACCIFVLACSQEKKDRADQKSEEKRVEEYSKRNITPQLDYDTTSNSTVDTISSAKSAEKQAEE